MEHSYGASADGARNGHAADAAGLPLHVDVNDPIYQVWAERTGSA